MKKYCLLFLIFLLFACKQKDEGVMQEQLKEFTKTVEGVAFKMIRIEKVKKTPLGKGTGKERIVTLSPFYIMETEVTQELYKAVTGLSPSSFDGISVGKETPQGEVQGKRPVETVNWYEAVLFCNKLTEKIMGNTDECVYMITDMEEEEGKIVDAKVTYDMKKLGFRLPTEAEFEYAARGGNENLVFAGGTYTISDPTGEEHALPPLKEVAWFNKNSNSATHEVAKKKPNGYGLFDMSGNVMEWCNDFYVKPIPENVEKDPVGTDEDTGSHTCKGGGYGFGGYSSCTVTARSANVSYSCADDMGFRVVCRL